MRQLLAGAAVVVWSATAHADSSAILPDSVQLGLVQRATIHSDYAGFGVKLSHVAWRDQRHVAIGYELGGVAGSGLRELSAQLRPAISPALDGLPVAAYLALGFESLEGAAEPDPRVTPVVGGGVEVMLPLPWVAIELGGQVLYGPDGHHSSTFCGALLFGPKDVRFRVGVDQVAYGDDSLSSWLTVGISVLDLPRPRATATRNRR